MEILVTLFIIMSFVFLTIYEYNYYKRLKSKADERDKFIKSLESRLVLLEQKLYVVENDTKEV